MTNFRFIPLAIALTAATTLVACNTAPSMPMPMAMAATPGTAPPDHLAHMDTQIKSMQAMHDKMMRAKTPEERSKLMGRTHEVHAGRHEDDGGHGRRWHGRHEGKGRYERHAGNDR